VIVVAGVLATTLAQPGMLGLIPLKNLLKNTLHADVAANAAFFFLIGLPWYCKPLTGILTDAFPLFGQRRKSYLLVSTVLAAVAWVGLYFTPRTYKDLVLVCLIIAFFMVLASTVVGAYLVEAAQAAAGSGRLTAVREVTQQACSIIQGPAGGYLAAMAFGWTAVASGGILVLLVPVTWFFLHEPRQRVDSGERLANAGRQLGRIGRARTLWAAIGLMALFYVAPGFGTALFYRQQNRLHMSTEMQGYLGMLAGVGGVLAAVGYGFICRKLSLRALLPGCLAIATATNLGYLYYSSFARAQIIDGINGVGYALAELVLMDLAIRATPAGSEGLGFSLMMSVRNLALFGTDWIGSKLLVLHLLSFHWLVLANSATTAATVPLVFLLPRAIVGRKDAEGAAVQPAGELHEQEPALRG
jgi:hypothetical protein